MKKFLKILNNYMITKVMPLLKFRIGLTLLFSYGHLHPHFNFRCVQASFNSDANAEEPEYA